MHTIRILAIAFVLLGLCFVVSRKKTGSLARGAIWFIPLWFVGAAVNLTIGVTQAGYTVLEELPFFLVVFGIPAIAAGAVWRKSKGK